MLSARDLLAWKGLVNENDIVPDLLDTLPWDAVFLSPAEQPEKAVRPGNDECGELPVRQPAFHVAHIAQAAVGSRFWDKLVLKIYILFCKNWIAD